MRKFILQTVGLCTLGVSTLFAAHASSATVTSGGPAADAFTLSCVPCGEVIACALRNTSTNSIQYSSYTIGYHGAVSIEYCDARTGRWQPCPLKTNGLLAMKSAGAGSNHVQSIAAGAVVPPAQSGALQLACPGEFSFVVRMADYVWPQEERIAIRITQFMGTMLGSALPVWKGRVVSAPVDIKPGDALERFRIAFRAGPTSPARAAACSTTDAPANRSTRKSRPATSTC